MFPMKKFLIVFLTSLIAAHIAYAQDTMERMVSRLKTFGAKLPQEQVFLHLDNSSYYLGDTLYYKAYVKRSDNGHPTNLSGILYCELLNNDGYLVERQMITLEKGEGNGNFALTDTLLYAGYYELRAYTKWQLNWGVTKQPHRSISSTKAWLRTIIVITRNCIHASSLSTTSLSSLATLLQR